MKRESGFSYITFAIRVIVFFTMMAGISCYAAKDNIPSRTVTMTNIGQDTTFQVFIKFHDYRSNTESRTEIRELDENVIIDSDHEILVEAYLVNSNNELEKQRIDYVADADGNISFTTAYNPIRTVLKKKALMSGALNFDLVGEYKYRMIITFKPLKEENFHHQIERDYTGIVSIYVIAFGLLAIAVCIGISSSRGSKDKKTNQYLSHLTSNLLKYTTEESSHEEDIFNDYLHNHPSIEITHDTYLDENKTGEYYAYLCKQLSFEERRDFILFLFKLAIDQDGIKNKEWSLLQQAMTGLRMNNITINYFNQKYGPLRTEYDDYAKYYNSQRTSATYSRTLSSDYAALGITSNAGKEEVQRAYHKMALQYHPDLPQNAGKEDFCTQKMTEINEAYERIISAL